MTPRQRRGTLLLVLAAAGAVGVFVAVASYVSGVRKQVTPKVTVLSLRRDIPAQQPISPADVRTVQVPQRYASATALRDTAALTGEVAASNLQAGSVLQEGMLSGQPELRHGQRELAIEVNADTGVAGKIKPGYTVDIEATFPGSDAAPPRSAVVVPNARIITVGTPRAGNQGVRDSQGSNGLSAQPSTGSSQVVPVTFALTPKQTLQVTYAESYATQVRLALIRPGDQPKPGPGEYILPPSRASG